MLFISLLYVQYTLFLARKAKEALFESMDMIKRRSCVRFRLKRVSDHHHIRFIMGDASRGKVYVSIYHVVVKCIYYKNLAIIPLCCIHYLSLVNDSFRTCIPFLLTYYHHDNYQNYVLLTIPLIFEYLLRTTMHELKLNLFMQ